MSDAAPPQPADDLVQRAAEVIALGFVWDSAFDAVKAIDLRSAINSGAQALADAGLLHDGPKLTDAPLGPAPCGCPRFVMIRTQRGCREHGDNSDLEW